MKTSQRLAALVLSLVAAAAACAVPASNDTLGPEDPTEIEADELSTAGKKLIGSYVDDSGLFLALVLTTKSVGSANEFFADLSIRPRCPVGMYCSQSLVPTRIQGTFTAGPATITLKSTTAPEWAKHVLGRYRYVVKGDKLSLSRSDVSQSLGRVDSYCIQASDCANQSFIMPACMGKFVCSETQTCGFQCGAF